MKQKAWVYILTALILALFGVLTAQAEIIPPRGEGQIGLQAVVLCETLTVRQAPSASAEAVSTLRYGDVVIAQPETGGWAQCFLSDSIDGGPAGWVNEDYLAIDPAWYRTEAKTPVYAWNDEDAPKVALLDGDTTLPILKDEGDWLIISLRGAAGWIRGQGEAAQTAAPDLIIAPLGPSVDTARRDGERFESAIMLEGMVEAVRYEHIVNDDLGIEIDYDYEGFERQSEPDRERFVSRYDLPGEPENYLEVRYSAEDADAACTSIVAALSEDYDVAVEPDALSGAGSCTRINASCVKGRDETADVLQTVYVVPAGDGCVIATERYTFESADGFGARFDQMAHTLRITRAD